MAAVTIIAHGPAARERAARALERAGIPVGVAIPRATRPIAILVADGSAEERVNGIRAERPDGTAVIAVLPDETANGLLRRALIAGADGIVLEGELDQALPPSVQAVMAGQLAVPARLRRRLAPQHLSHREKQVLKLVVDGYTNRQIADALVLAESTVKTHLSSAFSKLDARSRAEVTARVLDPDEGLTTQLATVGAAPFPA